MKELYCTVFNCDYIRGSRCCFYCRRRDLCRSRCRNHPGKCGLSREKVPNPYHTRTARFDQEDMMKHFGDITQIRGSGIETFCIAVSKKRLGEQGMQGTRAIKVELYCDNFQNYKRYNIPKAQLVIADIPYNLGANAYASNPEWYIGWG